MHCISAITKVESIFWILLQNTRIYSCIALKKRQFPSNDEYCYRQVRPQNGSVVVCAGGDEGQEIEEFSNKIGEDGIIHIFEPSKYSYAALSNKLAALKNIRVWPYALSSSRGVLDFYESVESKGASGFNVPFGNYETYPVEAISIDEWAEVNGIPKIDYIKMDIEGAEYDTLIGATRVIKEFKPSLAICVYHRNDSAAGIYDEDILRIPMLVKRLVSDYKCSLVNTEYNTWIGTKMFASRAEI